MTERRVEVEAMSACDAAVARELLITDPSAVFAPRTHVGVERRTFPMTLRVKTQRGDTAMHQVTVALGIPDTATGSRFPISWSPTSHRRALPSFHGTLDVASEADGTVVRIDGSYAPPLGVAGKLFDTVAGRRMAQQSIADLASYLGARLSECADDREASVSWHPALAPEPLRDRPAPEAWLG